jgi:signal transduction histidine kinase
LTAEGFKVDIEIHSKEILVNIDKDAISQAVLNLLNNAVKYSAERKYVLVEMQKAEGSVVISVTDHGIGIPAKEYKNIFNYFYRIPDSNGTMVKGTGLGLTITKYIIEAHKGTISVESEVNKGSKFIIKIPV